MSETKTTRKQLPAYLILALIALAAALLAVQVLFVVLTTRYLKDHFALIYGALEGIALITALYIYNKPGDLSYRVAWIIPILFVPVVGLILYLLYFGILTAQVQKKYAAGNAAARLFSYAPLIVFIAAFCSLQGMFSVSVYTLLYLSIISIGIAQNDCTKGKGALK